MNNYWVKINKIANAVVAIVMGSIIQFNCQSPVKTGVIQSSYNIEQSKEIDVFVKEYIPMKNKFQLGNDVIDIQEVWLENWWMYKNQRREIKKLDHLEGYLKFNIDTIDLFEITFLLNDKENGISHDKLSFEPVPNADTLDFFFYNEKNSVIIQCVSSH